MTFICYDVDFGCRSAVCWPDSAAHIVSSETGKILLVLLSYTLICWIRVVLLRCLYLAGIQYGGRHVVVPVWYFAPEISFSVRDGRIFCRFVEWLVDISSVHLYVVLGWVI